MYIPAVDFGAEFVTEEDFTYQPRHWNTGYDAKGPPGGDLFNQALLKNVPKGFLLAWDPIKQREAWRVPYAYIGNGGTLATKGNLVFQGSAEGTFNVYSADTGERLWNMAVQNGVIAAPVSYSVDGEQYVSVLVGRGGGISMVMGIDYEMPPIKGRVMTFKLGGATSLPTVPKAANFPEPPAKIAISQARLEQGMALFNRYCARCHGINAVSDSSVPDLRRLLPVWHDNFEAVVLNGMMEKAGMPRFDDVLDKETVQYVQAYIIERAHEDKALRETPLWWRSLLTWCYTQVANVLAWFLSLA
jgi:mono/diheme cytochrome c family protein